MSNDSTGKALVNPAYKYKKIVPDSPRNQKVILANRKAGVAVMGVINEEATKFFTHYAELPVFGDDE